MFTDPTPTRASRSAEIVLRISTTPPFMHFSFFFVARRTRVANTPRPPARFPARDPPPLKTSELGAWGAVGAGAIWQLGYAWG